MHWGEMARKGGVPPDRVLDAMRLAKLLRHLRRRRQTASPAPSWSRSTLSSKLALRHIARAVFNAGFA
jgi:hypothetical protein